MAERKERHAIQTCRNNDPSTDINILLLGQTGVGKSTFINGLVNYLCNDTVEDAIRDQMQFVIPSAFTYIDDDTFEEITIRIGERNEHENFDENGHSCTQQCRICILLKPNEERLTILFKFCVNELLRHLHTSASENIIFVFTNSRSTFFKPGSTSKILRALLDEHKQEKKIEVLLSINNTFLLDNEAFRYLALRQHGIQLNQE
ncbi:unnamed protein product [Rotaria sp. Silwood2]|nr:unnamed protein product [Rotaria sp. Silwood2]CAF4425459.1 unnamed protein product [Rotaria sp. Silwood2]